VCIPPARPSRRTSAGAVLALLLFGALVLLGGCTQVHTALAIQSDDTVTGDIVIGTAGGPAPEITVPPPLGGEVSVTPYQDAGYVGSRLRFSGLRFDQVNSLVAVAPKAAGRMKFELRRAGGLIALSGQVDLSAVPVDRADVQLKVAYPGDLVSTDGQDDSGTVSWVFTPGQVSQFNAVISSADPSAPSVARWSLLVAAVVAAAAVSVVLLAKANRNPPVRGAGRGL
jgi:hypothetical protein